MRIIKFRAWYQKEMYHWENNMGAILRFLPRPDIWIGVEVMQFTGLKDKNEKEIYEGDIVEYYYSCMPTSCLGEKPTPHTKQKSVVEYDKGEFNWVLTKGAESSGAVENIKIIGNIYENPELLEKKK